MLSELKAVIQVLLALLAALGPRTEKLARGTRRTAPAYLTLEQAREHAFAAVFAGEIYNMDPALLLAIAWHESNFEVSTVTPEIGGKVSCGVMTPEPIDHCPRNTSLLDDYMRGAEHLAGWYKAEHENQRLALLGYAGGGRLIRFCLSGGEARGCKIPEIFLQRAARILRNVGPSV
jgi:hypothetical protein